MPVCPDGQLPSGCRLMGEVDAAAWFKTEYCTAPWNGWAIYASEEVGVTPSNNDIESFWRALKLYMLERQVSSDC